MFSNTRIYPIMLILVGAGSLATAYIAQYGFGLDPCILCLYQRVPFAVVIALGFIGLWRAEWLSAVFAITVLTFATGAGIAVYHVGVEQHWWASAAGCGGKLATDVSPADLMAALSTKPAKACDQVDWTVLGVSMATWNVLFSSGLAAASLYILRTQKWKS